MKFVERVQHPHLQAGKASYRLLTAQGVCRRVPGSCNGMPAEANEVRTGDTHPGELVTDMIGLAWLCFASAAQGSRDLQNGCPNMALQLAGRPFTECAVLLMPLCTMDRQRIGNCACPGTSPAACPAVMQEQQLILSSPQRASGFQIEGRLICKVHACSRPRSMTGAIAKPQHVVLYPPQKKIADCRGWHACSECARSMPGSEAGWAASARLQPSCPGASRAWAWSRSCRL